MTFARRRTTHRSARATPRPELDGDDDVALVLRGDEARRDGPEPDRHETEQEGVGGEREDGSAYQAADSPSVAVAGPLEDPVETPEEPPKRRSHSRPSQSFSAPSGWRRSAHIAG